MFDPSTKDEFSQAPLIDRLHIELDDQQIQELNSWIDNKKNAIVKSRTEFMDRQRKYLFSYDDFISYVRKGPWNGSSNYHMPLTQIMVSAQISKLYNIITAHDATTFSPRETTDETMVLAMKKLRDWYLFDYINEYRGIKTVAWEACFDTVTVGFGLLFRNWLIKERKTLVIEENELRREMQDLDPQMEELARSVSDPSEVPEKKVDISAYKESWKIIKEFEGTKIQSVPFERCFFPNDIPEINDMDFPECVLLQSDTTLSQVKIKELQGEYREGAFDKAEAESPKADHSSTTDEKDIKDRRDHLTGYSSEYSEYTNQERVMEHCFCRYDVDGDGIAEDVIITRTEKGTLLKAVYLDRVSKSGKRPLYKFDCFAKPRQALSRGVPEFLYNLNEKMDLNHNMRQDYMQIQMAPMFAFRSSSSLDKQELTITPGKGIPVDDVNQDIRILSFNTNIGALFKDEQMDWEMANRMTSTSPLAQGQMPDTVGAQRSTSGVLTMLKQMDNEFKPRMEIIAQQWKRLEKDLLEDLDFRVDPQLKARVLGPSVEKMFENQGDFNSIFRITSMLDMTIDVASIINSEEMKKNDAAIIFQMLSTPGIAQQFGIVTPKGIYYAFSDVLKLYGRDPERYLDKPEFVEKALTLWQEIQVCGQGEIPPMSMMDDHEKKASELQAFMQTAEYQESKTKGLYVQNIDELIMGAVNKHMSLAMALQAQQQNIAQGGQQNVTQTMAGASPQQGGDNPNFTTSRDLGGGDQRAQTSGDEQGGEAGTSPEA